MQKVFICSPYRGDIEKNVADAKRHAHFAAFCGYCPVVPHLFFPQFLDDSVPHERLLGITLGIEMMKDCDEVWLYGRNITNGMAYELEQMRKLHIPVRLYDEYGCRINPSTMMLDDRISDEYRQAVRGLKFK